MTAFLITVFMVAFVLGLSKIVALILLRDLEARSIVFLTSVFWIALAGWAMYWIVM